MVLVNACRHAVLRCVICVTLKWVVFTAYTRNVVYLDVVQALQPRP